MLLAAPVLHHEAQVVRVEEQSLCVARPRRPEVDEEDDRELQAFRGVDGEQRDGLRAFSLLGRLSDGQLRVDELVEVPLEVASPGQRVGRYVPVRGLYT